MVQQWLVMLLQGNRVDYILAMTAFLSTKDFKAKKTLNATNDAPAEDPITIPAIAPPLNEFELWLVLASTCGELELSSFYYEQNK